VAAAAFRHFRASPYSDWAYVATDSGLLPLIARHGLLPQLQLDALPEGTLRIYRSVAGRQSQQTPALLRFPWPDEASIDPLDGGSADDAGHIRHNAWFTSLLPSPTEIDIQDDEDWLPIEEFSRSLEVASAISKAAAAAAFDDGVGF
jgi:hypothetical protein